MAGPDRWASGKTLLALVVAEPEDCLLEGMIGYRRDKSSLLRNAEIGKRDFEFELWFGAAESDVCCFAVDFAPTAQGGGDEPEGVNGVTLPAVVFSNQYRQIFFKTDSLVLERTELFQAQCFKEHEDSVTNSAR